MRQIVQIGEAAPMIPRMIGGGLGARKCSLTQVMWRVLLGLFLTSQTQPVFWR
jgi:hypothetical protein